MRGYNQMPKRLLVLVNLGEDFGDKSSNTPTNSGRDDFHLNLIRELNGCGVLTVYKAIADGTFPQSENDTLKSMNADAYLIVNQKSFAIDHKEISRISYTATLTDVHTKANVWHADITLNNLSGNPGYRLSDTITSMMANVDLIPTHCLVSSTLQQLITNAHPH